MLKKPLPPGDSPIAVNKYYYYYYYYYYYNADGSLKDSSEGFSSFPPAPTGNCQNRTLN
jgi:hypothetical protein